jgi:nitroreductase
MIIPSPTTSAAARAKHAVPEFPIHDLLAERWSPYAFADRPVDETDLRSLFEAARWAASSYNEQPWNYLVATRDIFEEHTRMVSCLIPGNQEWARAAPVLVIGAVSLKFAKNQADNRAAVHDLGLASANLVVEATTRGLSVHQMIGIVPDRVRELYKLPEHTEAWTAMAIGYAAGADEAPDTFRARDLTPRERKRTSQFVFAGTWGQPLALPLRS